MNGAVKHSKELARILALPRRGPVDQKALAAEMTEVLKTDAGTMALRPVQALALYDIGTQGGGFLPVGVGEGKTLISLLAAYVMDAKKPMLLLPATLIEKTEREAFALRKHWLIPTNIRLMSYEMLGRSQAADVLSDYGPDVILCDEVHKLKNARAAVTRRVSRYMHTHPSTRFVAMSGTVMSKSLLDFAHILHWCLKTGAPIPTDDDELDDWASALDESLAGKPGDELMRLEPGALTSLATPEEKASLSPIVAARRGFQRRLTETPGIVATAGEGERVDCSIYVKGRTYDMKPVTESHYERLRGAMQTPDGWDLLSGVDVWRHARELALGFNSIWSPRPPKEWLEPRKAWGAFVRSYLSHSRRLDSPEQVEQGVLAGEIDDDGLLEKWLAVKDTFTPNAVEVWHDDTVIRLASEWSKSPGIVWTEHSFFANRLAKETGLPYFGAGGLDADGRYIEDSESRTIIASIDANREGKNLQHRWSRNLIVSPPDGAGVWQQCIARTHRPGQTADEVSFDVLIGCREHVRAWRNALASTYAIRDTVGGEPKLLLADISMPAGIQDGGTVGYGSRW